MQLLDALLESWDRQCQILNAVGSLVDESNRGVKPSEDGWPLDHQLAHVHEVRREWLSKIAPERELPSAFTDGWRTPISDLDEIKRLLGESATAVREGVRDRLTDGTGEIGGYDHPVLFLQHMVWHEGWHVGLIMLALRLNGQEPAPEWEENHIWGRWRTEIWE